jgi:hypothetical protein
MVHDEAMVKLAYSWAIQDQDFEKLGKLSVSIARNEFRAHSLIGSKRFFQKLAVANGVAGWGYAYEGGVFMQGNK